MSNRPPKDITPQAFFETWMPSEYNRIKSELRQTPPDMTVRVELSGDGGGVWTLAIKGGAFQVTSGTTGDAQLVLKQSVEDWRIISAGGDSDIDIGAGSIDKLIANPAANQVLRTTKGTLRFEVGGVQGRTLAADLTFNNAAAPAATIKVDASTLAEIRSGALPAPQAFFAGKVQILGEAALAMQIGMALMPVQ